MTAAAGYILGVDVGGTFTDLALVRLSDGHGFFNKISSTPHDPSIAVAEGAKALLEAASVAAADVHYFGHGTTVATNAVITGRTAVTGLITTQGFRDILEIRRQRQPHNYDIRIAKPASPVPRHLRREMVERVYVSGDPAIAPDLNDLTPILDDFRGAGVEAIAVCFVHSYASPEHEAQVVNAVRLQMPDVFCCASHEVLAEFREFERMSTTVLNASLAPVMSRYLNRLEERAGAMGLVAPKILQSNGGVASPAEAGRLAVRTLVSGPAAGVTGAAHFAAAEHFPDIITFDVGGTSTDVCLIENGEPLIAKQREFLGYPVKFPMVDVHSVGAGGGSIAWVDNGGFLHVGPQSAGADPGPACYGKGGTEPTVTDANVVLGRLSAAALLAGRMPIHPELARRAIELRIARPMKLSVEEAAEGILTILNENLMQAVRVISVEKGFDPRKFVLVAFGGAGPLLASPLARELGVETVMVPAGPGLLCALGLLVAEPRANFSLTRIARLEEAGVEGINASFDELQARANTWFDHEGIGANDRKFEPAIDMRYVGQSHELTIGVQPRGFTADDLIALATRFDREHRRVYGYSPSKPLQIVTYRITAKMQVKRPEIASPSGSEESMDAARTGTRMVHFRDRDGFVACPIFDRGRLPIDAVIHGPAVLEQMDSTTIVLPGQLARNTRSGNLLLTFE